MPFLNFKPQFADAVAVARTTNSWSSSPDMSTKEKMRRRLQLKTSRESDSCNGMTARLGLDSLEAALSMLSLMLEFR